MKMSLELHDELKTGYRRGRGETVLLLPRALPPDVPVGDGWYEDPGDYDDEELFYLEQEF